MAAQVRSRFLMGMTSHSIFIGVGMSCHPLMSCHVCDPRGSSESAAASGSGFIMNDAQTHCAGVA